MINDLNKVLSEIWSSNIKDMHFDILNNTISFSLLIKDSSRRSVENQYNLVFKAVSAFFFVNDTGERRFNFSDHDATYYLELTGIDYHEDGIGKILLNSKYDWSKDCYANANFVLEIWNAVLFVEAGIVEINGKVYHTKKLSI